MNAFSVLLKILAAAAVIAGAVFAVVVYGDKIMGFVKKLLGRVGCVGSDFVDDCDLEDDDLVAVDEDFES